MTLSNLRSGIHKSAVLHDEQSSPAIPHDLEAESRLRCCDREIIVRPRHRVDHALVSAGDILVVEAGVLALETTPIGGRRQVLDFLMPGDSIATAVSIKLPGFHLRAITNAALLLCSADAAMAVPKGPLEAQFPTLLAQLQRHVTRRNLQQIMIGQLDTKARVASFLLSFALRSTKALSPKQRLELPMSRDDIADYLAMNPDTLSRIMMRFVSAGLVQRLTRHSINLLDVEKLGKLTPLRGNTLAMLCDCSPSDSAA